MTNRPESDAEWASLRRRMEEDRKLAQVIDSLDIVLPEDDDGEKRGRLRVPYANATTRNPAGRWN